MENSLRKEKRQTVTLRAPNLAGESPSPRRSFTLVELLVVMAVVAILISILVPALNKAMYSTDMLQCQNKLKSLGIGLFIYGEDNDDYYPSGSDIGVKRTKSQDLQILGSSTYYAMESSFLRQALPASVYDDSTFPALPRDSLSPPWG